MRYLNERLPIHRTYSERKEEFMKMILFCCLCLLVIPVVLTYAQEMESVDVSWKKSTEGTLGSVLDSYGIEIPAVADFPIEKSRNRGNRFITLTGGSKSSCRARIEVTLDCSSQFAQKFSKEKKSMLLGMQEGMRSGYPGMITKMIEIPDSLKAEEKTVIVNGKNHEILIMRATERFSYGVGDPSQAVFGVVMAFHYSEKKKILVQLELFYPINKFDREKACMDAASVNFP